MTYSRSTPIGSMNDQAFAAAAERAAHRDIAAHCGGVIGVCEGCRARPAMRDDTFCRGCINSDPRLREAYYGPEAGVA